MVKFPCPDYPSQRRQKEWLAVRALLTEMTGTKECEISYDDKGKPFLKKMPFQIGITHSRIYAGIILHPTLSVGIDIEPLRVKIDRVKHKFLSEREFAALPVGDIRAYMTYWCAKEAMYKWYGKRGLEFKEHLIIDKTTPEGLPLEEEGSLLAVVQKDNFFKK